MTAPRDHSPERLLSAALRAQAVGGSPGEQAAPAQARPKLPVLRVLLFALVLGLLAGAVAGALSLG